VTCGWMMRLSLLRCRRFASSAVSAPATNASIPSTAGRSSTRRDTPCMSDGWKSEVPVGESRWAEDERAGAIGGKP
jgi:hypothetical protein